MNKKILFFLFFFSNLLLCYSQQQFNYNFYIDETVREGTLFYNIKENTAMYLDRITSMKRVINKNKEDITDIEATGANFNENLDNYLFKNNNEVLFTYNLFKINYLVDDKLPKIEWMLSSEKKEIQNLICYKATATFRGRNWTAWYSPDVPISYGPWKFYGLPGLTVELKEDTNRFAFMLTGYILNSKNTAPTINLTKSKKVSMKKMAEITDEAFNNIMDVLSDTRSGEVNLIVEKSETKSGIELIYEWEEQSKK